MEYLKEFKELVDYCSGNGLYIGTGNPNAKILIIGKECAIDTKTEQGRCQYEREFVPNAEQWGRNICGKITDVEKPWRDDNGIITEMYNPLFPYKGDKISSLREGHTWKKYQKLIDKIYEPDKSRSDCIDFHKYCFITEMSDFPMPLSDVKNPQTQSSIINRLKMFKEKFFNKFPVVICACNEYIKGEQICETFNVTFFECIGMPRQRFWLHKGIVNNKKIVIHTRQLSMDVSDDLLEGIAKECKKYI